MSLPNAIPNTPSNEISASPVTAGFNGQRSVVAPSADTNRHDDDSSQFVDRRREGGSKGASERRQFGSSHDGLSDPGRELAFAIDQYKLQHHRRYITCDEMLHVITSLGYSK